MTMVVLPQVQIMFVGTGALPRIPLVSSDALIRSSLNEL